MTGAKLPELVGLSYSAWTLKARWALDAHGVRYKYREYLPMLGEPALRMRLGTPLSRVSVPVLFTDNGPFTDSWDIAQWAASNSGPSAAPGAPLITDANRGDVHDWNQASERLLAAGRARTTRLVLRDPAALAESVPPPLNKLGPVTRVLGAMGAKFILTKYGAGDVSDQAAVATMRDELIALRAALDGREFLLGAYSYADVAMALAFGFIAPPSNERVRLGANARPHWTCPELAEEFADLVAWSRTIIARWPESSAIR